MSSAGSAEAKVREAVIVGAGPAGLWAAFQLGIHGVRSTIIDSQTNVGGQCAALYADKPIFDVPGFPSIDAGDVGPLLASQAARFEPEYVLGSRVAAVESRPQSLVVRLETGELLFARFLVLATGLGPLSANERSQAVALPETVVLDDGHLAVTAETFETGCENIYAIGDAITYAGKLCLLASAFHEAALMAFAIRKKRAGEKRAVLAYSSTSPALKSIFTSD